MKDSSYLIGIDIGGTNIRIGAVSNDGIVENIFVCSSGILVKNSSAIDGIIKFINDYIEKHGYKNVEAVSIGFPSSISKDRKVIYSVPNIKGMSGDDGFDNKNVVDPLNKALGLPIYVNTDVDNLLLYDITKRKLKDKDCVIGIYIGTGYGNSVYLNQKFLLGKNGVACELGHVPVYKCDLICNCGKQGCVECVSSGFALREIWKENFSKTEFTDIFTKHANDQVLIDFIEASAIPVATEVNIFDPDYVIIGGGVIKMADFPTALFEEFIIKHTRKPYPANNLEILYSEYNPEAGLLGAALYARGMMKK